MFFVKVPKLFLLFSALVCLGNGAQAFGFPTRDQVKSAAPYALLGVVSPYVFIKYAYPKIKSYVHKDVVVETPVIKEPKHEDSPLSDILEDEIVKAVTLVFTPNSTITKLPEAECEAKLREKAYLSNLRLRVIEQLETEVEVKKATLSHEHYQNVVAALDKAKKFFSFIDVWRHSFLCTHNPYEDEYKKASIVDPILEKILVESIISGFKPLSECTAKELESKKESEERNKRIMTRLKEALTDKVFEEINHASHVLDFFHIIK